MPSEPSIEPLRYNPSITITGTPAQQQSVAHVLDQFLATQTGQNWLGSYSQTGHQVRIDPSVVANNGNIETIAFIRRDAVPTNGVPGLGSDVHIDYDPSF